MNNQQLKGVMTTDYARGRHLRKELKYRYMVRARVAANAVQKYLSKTEDIRVLDFGAADGRTLLEIRKLLGPGSFTGIEHSPELISFADKLPMDTQLVQGDVTNLPEYIKSQTFDVVIALALLEHLPKPIKAVRQAFSVLSPGGIFIASSPNPTWDKISDFLGLGLGEYHLSRMNRAKMIKVVNDSGLELVTYEQFMWAPIGFLPYLKVWVEPRFAIRLEKYIRRFRIFNWLFVNLLVVGKKSPLEIRL